MKIQKIVSCVLAILMFSFGILAQSAGETKPKSTQTPQPRVSVAPTPVSTPKLSDQLAKNLESLTPETKISPEKREQSLAKLLEGQRYLWMAKRSRSQLTINGRLARQAFVQAVELDPTLAEGYTALAELAWNLPPGDLDEAMKLSNLAIKIDRNNYGSQRMLARIYTVRSRLNRGALDSGAAEKAVSAWREVARLDSRNAEAWAFLSELYKVLGKSSERIEALKAWLGSAQPLDTFFYRTLMGGQADLSPENAAPKLGEAYFTAGRANEAIEVLNQVVADDPENQEAIDLLGKALDTADPKTAASSVQAIQQAIYANPGNTSLILLLAKIQARAGKSADTARFLNDVVAKIAQQNKESAALLQIALGDIYLESEKYDEALAEFQKAFAVGGIDRNAPATEENRDLALLIFDKIIKTNKLADRFNDAKTAILSSQKVLGDEDSFTDRQLIDLYRENGKRAEALQAVKFARLRFPTDYGFLRTEASLLTEMGRVDEGVAIVRTLIGKQNANSPSIMFDDFSNYLFISILFAEAKRGKDAIEAANKALEISGGGERGQIALLTLATGQNVAGDFKSAETTLRGILKDSPSNPIAMNNLGYFLVERNERLDEALKLIQGAVDIEPNNPSYLDSLGWAYFKLGKIDLAEENLKKALKIDPNSAAIYDHLGDVYQKQNKLELAKQMWQKALIFSTDAEQIGKIKAKMSGKKATK